MNDGGGGSGAVVVAVSGVDPLAEVTQLFLMFVCLFGIAESKEAVEVLLHGVRFVDPAFEVKQGYLRGIFGFQISNQDFDGGGFLLVGFLFYLAAERFEPAFDDARRLNPGGIKMVKEGVDGLSGRPVAV